MKTWLRYLKNKYHWFNKIRVSKTSTFVCEGDLIHAYIEINDNNTVIMGQDMQLINFAIIVNGEDNQVTLGADCHIEDNWTVKPGHLNDKL